MSDVTIPAQPEPDPNAIAQPDPAPASEGAPAPVPAEAPAAESEPQPAAAEVVAAPTEAEPASPAPESAAHPSGHEDGTILRTLDGFWEKIVHDVEGLWHKEPINEDGSPRVPDPPAEPFGHLPEGGDVAAPTPEG